MSSTCWWSWPCHVARACSKSWSWSLSRSRPCMTSAWSTMPCPSPPTYDGRERAQGTPSSPPSSTPRASPISSTTSSDITFMGPPSQGPPTTLVTVCPMRHTARAGVVAIGACLLLSGCFGSGSSKPTAADTDSPAASPTGTPTGTPTGGSSGTPTSPATLEPTTAPTSSAAATPAVLTFSPKSDGRHSHTCFAISGTAPVDYIYYPVMVTSSAPVTLDSAAVTYADGVQVAGSWVAPVGSTTGGVGTVEGWPAPAILAQSSS